MTPVSARPVAPVVVLFLMLLLQGTVHAQELSRVRQLGKTISCVVPAGNRAYIGEGAFLRVLDVSNPGLPVGLGRAELAGYCKEIAVAGNYVYCTVLDQGLQVVDVTDPNAPTVVFSYTVSKDIDGGVWWSNLHIDGDRLYCASGNGGQQSGLHVFDITNKRQPVLLGHYRNTRSYATGISSVSNIVYLTFDAIPGIQILDTTNPEAIVEKAYFLPGTATSSLRSIEIHGDTAYVSASFQDGLIILDVSSPLAPTVRGKMDTPNIACATAKSGNYLYITDMWDTPGVIVANIANPNDPIRVNSLNVTGCANNGIAVENSLLYVTTLTELRIYGLANPAAPIYLGKYQSPDPNAHGWGVKAVDGYAYLCDYRAGLKIFDVSTPETPKLLSTFRTTGEASAVEVVSSTAFVCNRWARSIDVLDVSNKANPQRRMTLAFPEPGWIDDAVSYLDYLYVAGREAGIYVVNISNPSLPSIVRRIDTPGTVLQLAVAGNRLVAADGSEGFKVYSLSNPSNPSLLSTVSVPGNTMTVAGDGNRVVVGVKGPPDWAIRTYDLSTPTSPQFLGAAYVWTPMDLELVNNRVYAQAHKAGVWVYDVTDLSNPVIIDKFDTEGSADRGISYSSGFLYSCDWLGGLNIFRAGSSAIRKWTQY